MRYLVLSDIHSNAVALDAVLEDAGDVDQVWCLGDVVGYGPDPQECADRLRLLSHVCVAGNHDWGVLGNIDLSDFNTAAREACLWNREQLRAEDLDYLGRLEQCAVQDDFTLVHGSPRDPIWEYIMTPDVARRNFEHFDTTYCFVGHTHVPVVFIQTENECRAISLPENRPVRLGPERLIINPGAVGQPRDGDPRAAYLILDSELDTVEQRRVEYAITAAQERMRSAGLPERLIDRLEYGW